MLVTEEQARTKWCPLALGAGARILGIDGEFVPAGPAVNRSMEGLPLALACCGSGCMAWRKVKTDETIAERGYCGAFGKPED